MSEAIFTSGEVAFFCLILFFIGICIGKAMRDEEPADFDAWQRFKRRSDED